MDTLEISTPETPGAELSDPIKYYQERQASAQAYNLGMAKWILASLIAMNGGAFVFLTKMDPSSATLGKIKGVFLYFILGLAAAVLCGFLAWLNTGMREVWAGNRVEQLLSTDSGNSESDLKREKLVSSAIVWSYFLSVVTGFASLGLFVVGATSFAARI